MPALKERPGDIPQLISRFVKEFSKQNGGRVTGINAEATKLLENYAWPGNVRQLRNVVEKMVVLSEGGELTAADVPTEIRVTPPPSVPRAALLSAPPEQALLSNNDLSLAEREKAEILNTIELCHGNKSKAAEKLGISRRTLHRRLHEWGIS